MVVKPPVGGGFSRRPVRRFYPFLSVDIPARRERDDGLSVDCVCDVLGELHDIGVRLSRVKEFERKLAQIFLGRFVRVVCISNRFEMMISFANARRVLLSSSFSGSAL